MSCRLIKLIELKTSDSAVARTLPQNTQAARALRARGLREGTEFRLLVRAPFGGPLLIETAAGVRIAVNRDTAEKITVEQLDLDCE